MIRENPIDGTKPKIHSTAFIAEDVIIIGNVEIGANVNIWYGAKLRGDHGRIIVGKNTSIQENCVIHTEPGSEIIIGSNIIIGHMAVVHGPGIVEDHCTVGLHATILQDAHLAEGCILAGGSVLRGNTEKFCLYAGIPAEKKKFYGEERIEMAKIEAENYVNTGREFKKKGLGQEIPKDFLID
ncbi:MAG: gamma carbonic anhydrase family protein [Candidatus Lokiarchaeota archaeon]|nr:gamma carbonic anhydrase family protein [Candidatus Lokiarchaeota archaeon]